MSSPPASSGELVEDQEGWIHIGNKRKEPPSPAWKATQQLQQVLISPAGSTSGETPETAAGAGQAAGSARVEKRLEKKRRKAEEKREQPSFAFDTAGFKRQSRLGINEVRDLALHISADGTAKQWLNVKHRSHIAHTLFILVPGLIPEHLGIPAPSLSQILPFPIALPAASSNTLPAPEDRLPVFRQLFSHGLPTRAPGDAQRLYSPAQTVLNAPVPPNEKKRREKEREKAGQAAAKAPKLSPRSFLLDIEQMRDNGYPLPSWLDGKVSLPEFPSLVPPSASSAGNEDVGEAVQDGEPEFVLGEDGWLETPQPKGGETGELRVLGMDCEMVMTAAGPTLARATIVDFYSGAKILDELVKPDARITDYVTRFSGLTAALLDPVTLTQRDLQRTLARLLTPTTILLGHSLESDLKALRLRHPWVIDTALAYEHPRRAPYKPGLKWLVRKWCDRDIQVGENGHDAEEDARACVELLQKKLEHGRSFGSFPSDNESVFVRLSRAPPGPGAGPGAVGRTGAIVDYGQPGQWHGAKAKTAVGCKDDDEIIQGLIDTIDEHDFVYGRLMELSNSLGWSQTSSDPPEAPINTATSTTPIPPSTTPAPLPAAAPTPPDTTLSTALASLNARIARLHEALPPRTALIVLSPHSDPRPALALNARRLRFQELYKAAGGKTQDVPEEDRFSTEDDRRLVDEAEKAKWGMAFFCVK